MAEKKKLTYEQAFARLEKITEMLDEGDLSLDESIKLFEESTELASYCSKSLESARLKVTKLSETGEES